MCFAMTNGRVWAFAYNLVLIPIAMGALYPLFATLLNPKMAAASMALSRVSVVTNSPRLRRFRVPKVARDTAHARLRARLKGWGYLAGIAAVMLAIVLGYLGYWRSVEVSAHEVRLVARAVQFDQPIIRARAGRWVRGVDTNEDTIYHDSQIDDLKDAHINTRPGQTSWATCYVGEPGVYEYSCAVPGHMEASMTEQLIVEP